jgi:hypothetical protein
MSEGDKMLGTFTETGSGIYLYNNQQLEIALSGPAETRCRVSLHFSLFFQKMTSVIIIPQTSIKKQVMS